MNSRRQEAFQGFARASVFQPPATVRFAFKVKRQGKWFPGQGRGQIKPGKPGRCRPVSGETVLLLGKPDEPAGGSGLRKHHGQRRLVELNQRASVRVAGQHEVTAEFRQALFRPPEGLALLDMPAGAGSREQALGGRLAAAQKREHGERYQNARVAADMGWL